MVVFLGKFPWKEALNRETHYHLSFSSLFLNYFPDCFTLGKGKENSMELS